MRPSVGFRPELHGSDQRQRFGLTHALPNDGGLATDGSLDGIELCNPPQRFSCDRRGGRLVYLVELPPRMGPAGCEPDVGAEGLEAWIAVDLNRALETHQMSKRTLGLAVGAVEIDGSRRIGTLPRSVVPGVDP